MSFLNDHDYSRLSLPEEEDVASALEAMEVSEAMEAVPLAPKDQAVHRPQTKADESGVDLAFDALMDLEENKELADFMRSDNIELLWNLGQIQEAVKATIGEGSSEDDEIQVLEVNVASKETKEIIEGKNYYKLRSKALEKEGGTG